MSNLGDKIHGDELPIVAAVGFFDGVHLGHKFLIEQIKSEADKTQYETAIITFTEHPQKVLGASFHPYLLTPFAEKISLLKKTGVDYCIPISFTKELSNYTAFQFMKEILLQKYNVRTLIIGYDHRFGNDREEGFDEYKAHGEKLGIDVVKASEYSKTYVSSSKIRKLLSEGHISEANKLLGYNYVINGVVVDGLRIARTLGFPTANLQLLNKDVDKMLPMNGVYAAKTYIDGKKYDSMVYLGRRPTMLNNGGMSIETHIIDFDGDLYGKMATIELLEFIRDDIKFKDKSLIKPQIEKDYVKIKEYFNSSK